MLRDWVSMAQIGMRRCHRRQMHVVSSGCSTNSLRVKKNERQLRAPAPRLGPHGGDDLGGELVQVGVVEVGPQHGQSPVKGTGEKVQAQSDVGVGGQFAARDGPLDELSGLGAPGISYRLEERGGEVAVAGPFGEQIRNDPAGYLV